MAREPSAVASNVCFYTHLPPSFNEKEEVFPSNCGGYRERDNVQHDIGVVVPGASVAARNLPLVRFFTGGGNGAGCSQSGSGASQPSCPISGDLLAVMEAKTQRSK